MTREADGGGFGVGAEGTRTAYFPGKAHRLRPAGDRTRATTTAGHDRHGRPHAPARHLHLRDPPTRHPGRHPGARRPWRSPPPGGTADAYQVWSSLGKDLRDLEQPAHRPGRRHVMAYDEGLTERIRERLGADPDIAEKRMFGGIAFLHHGNVAVGVSGDDLMVRVCPEATDEALARPGARIFDMAGRPMRGWSWSRAPPSRRTRRSESRSTRARVRGEPAAQVRIGSRRRRGASLDRSLVTLRFGRRRRAARRSPSRAVIRRRPPRGSAGSRRKRAAPAVRRRRPVRFRQQVVLAAEP